MLICRNLELAQGTFQLQANVTFGKGVTAVIGPSGAGKSTLLLAIGGFVGASAGQISYDDLAFTHIRPGKRPVSMLFQDNNLFPHLTLSENIGLGLRRNRKLSRTETEQIEAFLERVGLAGMGGRKPAGLSGGQQSRVALARVLIADRPIVLLDEPFAALGPGLKEEMLDLMRESLSDATVLMVTHDPNDARRVADQIAWVANGNVQAPGPAAEIFADPPQGLRKYLGAMG